MKWLVISDIHSAIHDFPTVNAQAKLINKIKEEGQLLPFDFILITGDCMDKCQDMELAIKYIKLIMDACKIDANHIFICPGNHDILRRDDKNERNEAIEELRKGRLDKLNYLYLDGENSFPWRDAYNNFIKLYQSVKESPYEPFSMFEPEGENYRIVSIDSCLFSKDDNDANHLHVCTPQLMKIGLEIKDDNKLNIAMMHHGVAFLEQDDARRFENWLADYNIDVLYCGHNHRTGMAVLADAIRLEQGNSGHRVREFTCGACHVNDVQKTEATFFVCEYETGEHLIRTKAFHFASKISNWCKDTNSTRPFYEGENIYKIPRKYNTNEVSESKYDELLRNDYGIMPKQVYDDPNDADIRIKELVSGTEFLYYMGIKGDSIYDDYHGTSRFIQNHQEIEARFLLANPCSDYMKRRLMSLPEYNGSMIKLDKHWSDLYKKGINLYEECEKEPKWSVRYHNEPILFRLYIFSQSLLMSFYLPGEHSKYSTLYEYGTDSRMYQVFKAFFEEKWKKAQQEKPEIDLEHNFLKWDYDIVPSLVLNVSDACNLNCYYCPDGGENLHKPFAIEDYVGVEEIFALMDSYIRTAQAFEPIHKFVLRITGGEPLQTKELREKVNAIFNRAKVLGFQKIVLCTNGMYLSEAYEEGKEIWNNIRNELLLKVSVDTLNSETFRKIARPTKPFLHGAIDRIKEGITELNSAGFQIELNTVMTQYNISELREIYQYACGENILGVKVFTINDFGGAITVAPEDKLSKKLKADIQEMIEDGEIYIAEQSFLNGDAGIRMSLYSNSPTSKSGCTLKIVDHQRGNDCLTPDRTYSRKCEKCNYYKDNNCSTGLMSLTMRVDGLVSYCRLKEHDGYRIKGQSAETIHSHVHEIMEAFKHCKRT